MDATTPPVKNIEFNPDRGLRIRISEDKLQAFLVVKPAWLIGGEISNILLIETIDLFKIKRDFIDMPAVDKAAVEITNLIKDPEKHKQEFEFLVANGSPAKPGKNGWIKYYFPRAQRVVLKESGQADFRNVNRYVHVKEGELLATMFEGVAGEQGTDVEGLPIYPGAIEKPTLTLGRNIIPKTVPDPENPGLQLREFFSGINGAVFSIENSLTVSPELTIESDVGLGTGNVNFDGTIRIQGTIEEGATVTCNGSIHVEGNVESSEITVGEDLDVKGGIKGKGKGLIRVKGDLKAKFIENAIIEVDGDCIIETFILHAKIYCLGNVILSGDSASLVGSEIVAYKGVSIAVFGSTAQNDTVVEVGYHYKNDRLFTEGTNRLHQMEKEMETLLPEIQKIKEAVQRSRGKLDEAKKAKFKEIFDSYQQKNKTLELLRGKVEELKLSRYNHDPVKVVVRNTAHPGSIIKYKRQVEKITKQQSSFLMNFMPNQERAVMSAYKAK